jgi:hypothetical protein
MKQQTIPVTLINRRNSETWLCDDLKNRRDINGVQFIEVYKAETGRKVWMNSTILELKK